MFQWFTKQFRPYTVNDLIEELAPGHGARMARLDEIQEVGHGQWHQRKVQELKRARLNQELEDTEWILNYEKRLAALQKKTVAQRSQVEQLGTNTDRLRKLERHLAGLRRSLD